MTLPETERLRRCRIAFEIAQRDNLPMAEARRREAQDRWAVTDARLRAARCGTMEAGDEGRQLAWWQK